LSNDDQVNIDDRVMTYNVLSGRLNPHILYHTITYKMKAMHWSADTEGTDVVSAV